jgi:hypothetical protein
MQTIAFRLWIANCRAGMGNGDGIDVETVHKFPQCIDLFFRNPKAAVVIRHRCERAGWSGIDPMPAEQLGTLPLDRRPILRFCFLAGSCALAVVAAHPRRRRTQSGDQCGNARQFKVPNLKRDGDLD